MGAVCASVSSDLSRVRPKGARRNAARQINNALCNQLAEKTMFLLEFREYTERHPVQAAATPSAVNVPYVRRDIDFPEDNPNYTLTVTKN